MQEPGSLFLHEKNFTLHNTDEVEAVIGYLRAGGECIPNEPAAKISAYLGFLAHSEYVNDGILTGDQASIDRQVEAASVALTKDNAEAYVKFQAKVARELGRGAELDPTRLDDSAKMTALRKIRQDQQLQLKDWVNELNSTENKYPNWFKYWMLNSVTRYTEFNEEVGSNGHPKGYEKRSGSSFGLFPALDRESVSLVYDALVEKLGGQPMGFEYGAMRALLKKADFGELYDEAQNHGFKITEELKAIKTGSWHNFAQSGHAEDGKALSALVRSYRTGWCTAGIETATTQLQAGDFCVWCSTNPKTGKDEVPRIAVRMENGVIAEVRGIVGGRRQELEPGLEDIVMDKIRDLPGGESYFKKAEDMKRLTAIEKKTLADPNVELTTDELRFLYELDHEIKGFGYQRDPRVAEIRAMRGDRDKPELARILLETIRKQLQSSYTAYRSVADQLLGTRSGLLGRREIAASVQELEQLFATKDKEWQENGVYDYLVEKLIADGATFTLVATPNVEATEAQVRMLCERQECRPELRVRVPSLLDAVTHWYSLRAGGDKLDDNSAFNKTYIRHFDLEPKTGDGWSVVPDSFVSLGGKPNLYFSGAGVQDDARLAVG